jgi:hypothetical protein
MVPFEGTVYGVDGSLATCAMTAPEQSPGSDPSGCAVEPSVVAALAPPALASVSRSARTDISDSLFIFGFLPSARLILLLLLALLLLGGLD